MKNLKIISGLILLLAAFTFISCDNEPIDSSINIEDFGGTSGGNIANIVGTYKLTHFNTSVPTDLNGDGVKSTNQMNETVCFNNSFLVLGSNNTFAAASKGVEIDVQVDGVTGLTTQTMQCYEDPPISGTWSKSGNIITLSYTQDGEQHTDSFTLIGNTLQLTVVNGEIVGTVQSTGAPAYLTSNITIIYTKQ
jgi:hypothetical protein